MTYIEAQNIAIAMQEENNESAWEAFGLLDDSWRASTETGKWEPCEMPNVPEFGWWVKGIPTSSRPKEDGSWCTWSWKQPKTENFVYCITKIRRPVEASKEWETIEEAARKPLFLTDRAKMFFANLNH